MNGVVVRLTDSKEIVGFFFCNDLNDLFWTIDEITDPGVCEYLEVAPGCIGFVWASPGHPVIHPYPDDDDEEFLDDDLSGLSLTEWPRGLLDDIANGDKDDEFVPMLRIDQLREMNDEM